MELQLHYKCTLNYILVCFLVLRCCHGEELIIKQGRLRGTAAVSENGNRYFVFKGIPFAQPPIGDLRFQPPVPLNHWDGTLDASEDGPTCYQAALGLNEGQEDCLFLNVFTPELPSDDKNVSLPVLVWLHGGSFVTGSAKDYDPFLLMNRRIVLVIPQYRLGLFGYYSTRSSYGIGNYGTLDQTLALRWVQENIAEFGGNPESVTLGGDCAGGVSAIHHMISPLSKDLFKRVISFSGSPLSPWALKPKHNRLLLMISNKMNCPNYDLQLQADCLRKKSAKEVMEAQKYLVELRDYFIGNDQLAPAVQVPEHVQPSDLVLERHPLESLLLGKYNKVPVLLGVTKDVGSYIVDIGLYDFLKTNIEEDPKYVKGMLNEIIRYIGVWELEKMQNKLIKFYFADWDFKTLDASIPGLEKLLGDTQYNAGILALAKILSYNADTRMLRFEYEGGPKLFDTRHLDSEEAPSMLRDRVSHGDELFSFLPVQQHRLTAEERKVVENMLNILEDFVSGKEPRHDWPLFSKKDLETTVITADGGIKSGVRFATPETEKMLDIIFRQQHYREFQELEAAKIDHSLWQHDEL